MKKLFLTLALACIGLSANAQEIRRSWSGELEAMGQKLPIVLNLVDDKCTLDSPAQGATGIPATVDLLTNDSIKVSVKSLGATYVARFVDGTFPNYSAVIPAAGDNSFEVNRKDFIASLDRVSVISDDKSRTVRLELKSDTLCLSSINVTTGGSGKDEIPAVKTTEEPWDACFNARYMLDVADAVQSEKLKVFYTGRLSSILILPENGTAQFVVMPMRI